MSQRKLFIRCPHLSLVSRWATAGLTLALLLQVSACRDEPTAPDSDPDLALAAASAPLPFREVSGGIDHTCGITTDNRAYCWGSNGWGQLGDGTRENRSRPVAVAGGLRFHQVSAGGWDHTCGVTTDFKLYCWGSGGNLGDGTTNPSSIPVPAAGARPYLQVDAGIGHTCAIGSTDRHVYCWGGNNAGQLGNGTNTGSTRPVPVADTRRFRQVAAGDAHTCGVTMAGAVLCWGSDSHGQIGDGATRQNRPVPTRIASARQFNQISAFWSFSCALAIDGRAFCWGEGGGGLGDGSTVDRYEPRAVAGGISFVQIATGSAHTCARTSANQLYCWGNNVWGQHGNGTTEFSSRPVIAAGGRKFSQLGAGGLHTCGITSGSAAYCWGYDVVGQLGDGNSGTGVKSTTPVAVLGP
jgi:alpha-tubulin suppressor-like RCC1 family protein